MWIISISAPLLQKKRMRVDKIKDRKVQDVHCCYEENNVSACEEDLT